jgi:hypothetical protein
MSKNPLSPNKEPAMGEEYGNPSGGIWSSGASAVKGGEVARQGQSPHDETVSSVAANSDVDPNLCRCGHIRARHSALPVQPHDLVCDETGCWCGGFQVRDGAEI